MALLMVHLLAAQRWAEVYDEYRDCPEFYLGAISPDAIHVRDHDDKSRKNMFHLNNWMSPHIQDVLDYWKEHHTPFDIGYGIHVLTDAQWVPRFHERVPQICYENGKIDTKTYYRDTFVTDFGLFAENGQGERLLQILEKGVAPDNHPLLTKYEFDEWRKMMLSSYRGKCPQQGVPEYIDREYVLSFLDDCQEMLHDVYRRYCNE